MVLELSLFVIVAAIICAIQAALLAFFGVMNEKILSNVFSSDSRSTAGNADEPGNPFARQTAPNVRRSRLLIGLIAGGIGAIAIIVGVILLVTSGGPTFTTIGAFEKAEFTMLSGKSALLVRYNYDALTQFRKNGNSGLGPWNREEHYIIDDTGTKHLSDAIAIRSNQWKEFIYDQQQTKGPLSAEAVDGDSYFYAQSLPMLMSTEPPSSQRKSVTLLFTTVAEGSRTLRLGYKGSEIPIAVTTRPGLGTVSAKGKKTIDNSAPKPEPKGDLLPLPKQAAKSDSKELGLVGDGPAQGKPGERDQAKGVPVREVNKLLTELGFEVAEAGVVTSFTVGGETIRHFMPECKNPKTKVKIHYLLEDPGARYYLGVSHGEARRNALMALAGKISPKLEQAAKDAAAEFNRTNRQCQKSVGKMRVRVNKKGLAIESDPAPGRFDSDPNP